MILHYAGSYGDLWTLKILREARMSGIDVHAKDDMGATSIYEILPRGRVALEIGNK